MEELVSVDEQGRIYLSKHIRKKADIKPGAKLNVMVKSKKIVLEPRKSVVRESRGIFKTKRPLEDVDRLVEEGTYEEVAGDL